MYTNINYLPILTYRLKKRYTSILTSVCTAATSFGLIVVFAWTAYEQWIAPVMLSRPPLSGLRKIPNIPKGRKLGHEATPIRPLPRRSRTGSFSDLSDSFTLSDEAPTHILVRTAQTLGSRAIPGIRNGIQSLFPTSDSATQHQSHDLESALPAQQATGVDPERPANFIRAITLVHAATKLFWRRGTARNVPRMDPTSPRTPGNTARTSSSKQFPFSLVFPSQPQHVLKYAQGEVRDLEYSPGGLVLAVTR
jgi:hypothetical protein